jgi:hypothetical protein
MKGHAVAAHLQRFVGQWAYSAYAKCLAHPFVHLRMRSSPPPWNLLQNRYISHLRLDSLLSH